MSTWGGSGTIGSWLKHVFAQGTNKDVRGMADSMSRVRVIFDDRRFLNAKEKSLITRRSIICDP